MQKRNRVLLLGQTKAYNNALACYYGHAQDREDEITREADSDETLQAGRLLAENQRFLP